MRSREEDEEEVEEVIEEEDEEEVENLRPVHMMQIDLDLETEEGKEIVTKIWNTIHVAK